MGHVCPRDCVRGLKANGQASILPTYGVADSGHCFVLFCFFLLYCTAAFVDVIKNYWTLSGSREESVP